MINHSTLNTLFSSPSRVIKGKVELSSSTIAATLYSDRIKSITIERTGENNKFFGFGVSHKLKVKLADRDRALAIGTDATLRAAIGSAAEFAETFPTFYLYDINRDENNNDIDIEAYDVLYKAKEHTVAELDLAAADTIVGLAIACAELLDLGVNYDEALSEVFETSYPDGANFDGTETIRRALDVIAEATQTIYYVNTDDELVFRRLDKDGAAVMTIDKSIYFELDSKPERTLTAIAHTTELGDNVSSASLGEGETQYVRDNSLWEMRSDVDIVLEEALAAIGGLSITPFSCKWRGNPLLEIGDKIALVAKDNSSIESFVINESITYTGGLSSKLSWEYKEQQETHTNPATLGEALNYTFAKVDKINREITLVASETTTNANNISQIQMNTESISASVTKETQDREAAVSALNDAVVDVSTQVSSIKLESDRALLEFKNELNSEGVSKVDTGTGFVFDASGMTVETTTSDITTRISENGMLISNKDTNAELLLVNNEGVDAENLRATTYLIIGGSRLENYGTGRTGCFWIDI